MDRPSPVQFLTKNKKARKHSSKIHTARFSAFRGVSPYRDPPGQRSVADLGGMRDVYTPLGVQILSISCSFWENLVKSYVGTPPRGLVPPPRGNPGSATGDPPPGGSWDQAARQEVTSYRDRPCGQTDTCENITLPQT